jgi:hypothetical protein
VAAALRLQMWGSEVLMVGLYIARTSIMNSTYPLQKSVFMDYVQKVSQLVIY